MNSDQVMFGAFITGALFTMICDVLFSIANYFLQRAFKERAIRRAVKKQSMQDQE